MLNDLFYGNPAHDLHKQSYFARYIRFMNSPRAKFVYDTVLIFEKIIYDTFDNSIFSVIDILYYIFNAVQLHDAV